MKKRFVPDIFTLLLALVFVANLGYYLQCRYANVSSIEQRDRHTRVEQGESSQKAERERLRRGEGEQELRDPNQAAPQDPAEGDAEGGDVPSAEDGGSGDAPGAKDGGRVDVDGTLDGGEGGINYAWLSSALASEGGRQALEELKSQEGELKLTAAQERQLHRGGGEDIDVNARMNAVLSVLRPEQMNFLLENKEQIDHLAASPISLESVTEDTLQKLSRVQGDSMRSARAFSGDRGLWSPKPIAIGIAMLTETAREECLVSKEQAGRLSEALRRLVEADRQREAVDSQEELNLEAVLNAAQINFLYKKMRSCLD